MSSSKKKKPSKKVPPKKQKSLKGPSKTKPSGWEEVLERLRKVSENPENENCVWLVELVIPPGSFIARKVPEPVDREALSAEVEASAEALRKGNDPERHRFLITYTSSGGVARQYAKEMCRSVPNPEVPMSANDRFNIEATLHAQFIGDEEY